MKLGISTACFYPLETEKALSKCVEMNSQVYEVFLNSFCEVNFDFLNQLKDIGVKEFISVHPFTSGMESYLLFSSYKRRFNDGRDFYKNYYETAAELGAKYVVLHGAKTTGHISIEEYSERYFLMNSDAKSFGVALCQENVNGFRSMSPEFINGLRNTLKDDINFVFDVKQAVRSNVSICDMLVAMGKNVVHVHLSDNTDDNDCLLPGRGAFDFKRLFDYLNTNTVCQTGMIEVYSTAYKTYDEILTSYNFLKSCI